MLNVLRADWHNETSPYYALCCLYFVRFVLAFVFGLTTSSGVRVNT
ncbi:hypothetical protein ENTCAN_06633 [Enterobacter cancerogenus ATCC 35316]|nr:hypothetical protein ENTCAN_06633 [Enterobacter cancerogenus ATCC 35316]